MIKGKKGAESEMWAPGDMPFWIIFGVALGFTAIIFFILISSSGVESATIKGNLESYFLIERLLRSKNCFAFYDAAAGTTYSGVLDYKKFNDLQLDNCMSGLNQNTIAFKITLSSPEFAQDLPKTIRSKNWNENRPIESREGSKKVVISHNNNLFNGDMSIEMQNYKG